MATFNTGALGTATNHNFVSYYEAHEPDISNELVQRYANSMIGFLDLQLLQMLKLLLLD
jgi:hypothetical protein